MTAKQIQNTGYLVYGLEGLSRLLFVYESFKNSARALSRLEIKKIKTAIRKSKRNILEITKKETLVAASRKDNRETSFGQIEASFKCLVKKERLLKEGIVKIKKELREKRNNPKHTSIM